MHDHGEERGHFFLVYIFISAALLLTSLLLVDGIYELLACAAAYLFVGLPVLREAAENILHGHIFDENFLMTVASVGAFAIGEPQEAAAVMLLYQIGEYLQDTAIDTSRNSIRALLAVRPDSARLENGELIPAADAGVGTVIMVKPGERIPLDGIIRAGSAFVDTSPMTGESMPRQYSPGDTALAGCICTDGTLTVEVTKPYAETSLSRMMALAESAQEHKAKPERFITRFAGIYTPAVCAMALLIAGLPPLFLPGTGRLFLHKALAFLVISCPCALVISVPLSFFAGIGRAGHHGILFKGSNALELLAKAELAAFDKTGTLTGGEFTVTEIVPVDGVSEERLLEIAAYCESQSNHPLARGIVARFGKDVDQSRIRAVKEVAGKGISASFDGKIALAGKRDFSGKTDDFPKTTEETAVFVTYDGIYCGYIALSDTLKNDSISAVKELRKLGLRELTMLSGDRQNVADLVAAQIGLDEAYGELLPEEKVKKIEQIKSKGITIYAGDGINDAPVLASADVGIAMGSLGSDAAMEASDVVIMTDGPAKIPQAISISRKTMKIAKENIIFSIGVKVLIMALSLLFDLNLWVAVFADVGVCLLAVLNSLRALREK